jgi:3-dehydroquinate dehydratase
MIERLPYTHVQAREGFRHHSVMAPIARGIIIGFGVKGYKLAIRGPYDVLKPSSSDVATVDEERHD